MKEVKCSGSWLVLNEHIPSWVCHSISKPKMQACTGAFSRRFYEPVPIELLLVDPVGLNMNLKILDLCNTNAGELGETKIQILDKKGKLIETWTLNKPYISKVSFGQCSYVDSGASLITLEVLYEGFTIDFETNNQNCEEK